MTTNAINPLTRRKLLLLTAASIRSVKHHLHPDPTTRCIELLESLADNTLHNHAMHARAVNAQFPVFRSTPQLSLINAMLKTLSVALDGESTHAELVEEVADVLRYAEEVSLLPSS